MTPHFCPGSVWLCLQDFTEHEIIRIGENTVQTISPPEPWKLPTPELLEAPVVSWHGNHATFLEDFMPPEASAVS